jgi:hypothetical protein
MYKTYLIASKYLTDEKVDNYFKPKGWKKAKNKEPTLLYLDSIDNIGDKKFYSYHSFIKNLTGESKHLLTDKSNLALMLPPKYLMKTFLYDTKENIDDYKDLFKGNKKWILKPAKGREGIGIRTVKNFEELKDHFQNKIKRINFKGIKERNKWVIQEYIDVPMLYENRKFHFRVYFLIVGKEIYYFSRYMIYTADEEYKNEDYANVKIHDSHYSLKSIRNRMFPDDFKGLDNDLIYSQVHNIFKHLKKAINLPMNCYPEDENCYEIFAADIMVLKNQRLKVLEFNHSIGYPESVDKRYPLFENQLDIVLSHYNLIKKEERGDNNYFIKV